MIWLLKREVNCPEFTYMSKILSRCDEDNDGTVMMTYSVARINERKKT
jgi:hypothetical protein